MFDRATKLYELIRKLGIVKHKKRQEFLNRLIEGCIKSRSVLFSEIADKIESDAKPASVERRVQDFFQKVNFDYQQLIVFFLSFIHHDELILSIDRTEWDFGVTQINVLCIIASIGKMGVPLYFELLDNNSGNSNWENRIELFKELFKKVGKERIALLVMDREFIGHKWLQWLKAESINFCVRVPKNHKITLDNGDCIQAEQVLLEQGMTYFEGVYVDLIRTNVLISYDANGDLLYLIGTARPCFLAKQYKRRWTIEVFFQALKGRGFHLEQSCLRCLVKYRKLFAVVSMAYTLCWAVGITDGKENPVKVKKHGYPQYSVFRRGLNILRDFYRKRAPQMVDATIIYAFNRLAKMVT